MTGQNSNAFSLQRVPDIACPVVITSEQDTAGNRESDRCDTAKDIVVRECVQLTISANIKQAARSIVRSGCKSIAVWEETEANNK